METLIEQVAKAIDATHERFYDPTPGQMARAALDAVREAGYVVVPHDISNEACDAALRATGSWLDIKGSALTVNREKMRRRWRNALIFYKNLMDATTAPKAGDRARE